MSEVKPAGEWALVELMGHRQVLGFVTEVVKFGRTLIQIDVPDVDGITVATQRYSPEALYGQTLMTEAAVLERIRLNAGVPYSRQLGGGSVDKTDDFTDESVDAAPVKRVDFPDRCTGGW